MLNIFKKKKLKEEASAIQESQPLYRAAPGTEIRYNPDLVVDLKSDHRQLLDIYGEIQTASDGNDFKKVADKLREFRNLFNGHILTENVRLYVYMERALSQEPVNAAIIKDFKQEMNAIGMAVHNFLTKYDAIGESTELAFTFSKEFAEVGKVLVSRVENEEKVLYPLYAPYY